MVELTAEAAGRLPPPATSPAFFSHRWQKPLSRRLTTWLASLLAAATPALAQSNYNTEVPKAIVILQSTRDYAAALAGARQAAARLQRPAVWFGCMHQARRTLPAYDSFASRP